MPTLAEIQQRAAELGLSPDLQRSDAALERLLTLGAIVTRAEPTRGRPSSLWSAIPKNPQKNQEAEAAANEELAESEEGDF